MYYFRNFYSIGIFIWLFCSFLYLDINPIKTLVIYILIPSVFISLLCIHGSSIFSSYFDFDDLKDLNELD